MESKSQFGIGQSHWWIIPVLGEIRSEIGALVSFYSNQLKVGYESKFGRGVMGKRLVELLSVPSPIEPEDLIDSDLLGIRNFDGTASIPTRYEEEFQLDLGPSYDPAESFT